jgi:hypothetical protein
VRGEDEGRYRGEVKTRGQDERSRREVKTRGKDSWKGKGEEWEEYK